MKTYAVRLQPNQDLKTSLENYARENQINAGVVLTCVGSLNCATLRMANKNILKTFEGKFEIVSLVGTFSSDGCHLHIALSDKDGNMEGKNDLGSHLIGKCTFNTEDNTFSVEWDGYWDTWTGRAYDVDGEIQFFDSTTSRWRTTFKKVEAGKLSLEL